MDSARPETDETTSLRLAHYVSGLRPADLTATNREAAIACIFDLLACAAAGLEHPSVIAAQEVAASLHAGEGAGLWFTDRRANLLGAVLANSTAGAVLDLDDGFRLARGHPGAAVIPTALSAAPADASVEDVLTAIVAGYEVGTRIAMGQKSYAPSGVWAPYAAIATAGWLWRVPAEQLAHALAIAAQTAPAMRAKAGLVASDVKEGIPFGALAGLNALALARHGFTGPLAIFDRPELFDSARISAGLGEGAFIDQTYFKLHACCRHLHAPIEALATLIEGHGIAASDIREIEVHTYQGTFNLANAIAPASLIEVQYSVPYCLGLCALYGVDALLPIDPARVGDPAVEAIAAKVKLLHDPEIEARFPAETPTRVVVHTTSGRFESPVTTPRGDPASPLSWDERITKFRTATRHNLEPARQEALLAAIESLRAGTLTPLRAALAGR
ncbi:MAG: MmgE/PrpD family protein [Aestuariivirga sp.]